MKPYIVLVLLIVLTVNTLAHAATAVPLATFTTEAVADAYIISAQPNSSFGQTAPLVLGSNSGRGYQRTLLQFDISGLPVNLKTITRAYLYLYQNGAAPALDAPMNVTIYRLTQPWSEQISTWNNTNSKIGPQVGTAVLPRDTGFYELDITTMVTDWRNNTYPNYGVILLGSEDLNALRERSFGTREGSAPFRPRLFVEYTVYNDNTPPNISVNPLPASANSPFTVSWSGTDVGEAGIAYYDVQYQRNGGGWTDWASTTAASKLFDSGILGSMYEFRARGVDRAGNVEAYGAAEATILYGLTPPTAAVNPLPAITPSTTFQVTWTGHDPNGLGISGYDVRYRFHDPVVGWTAWADWQTNVPQTFANFTAPTGDGLYQFEARARTPAAVAEQWTGTAEASTFVDVVPPFITPQVWLPLIHK